MRRSARLQQVWDRLPMFRAVAETEHLPTAAEQMNVTAPAVSRSVKHLEEQLGAELFQRLGRRLELNNKGEHLLQAVRTAMRLLDDAVREIDNNALPQQLTVSSVGPFTNTLLGSLVELDSSVMLSLCHLPDHEIAPALLQGRIDLAIVSAAATHPELVATTLGTCSYQLYCGKSHPLAHANHVSQDDLTKHIFAAPLGSVDKPVPDRWPPDVPRNVRFWFTQAQTAMQLITLGRHLCVLPDLLVNSSALRQTLVALPWPEVARVPMVAVHRKPIGEACIPAQVVTLLGQQFTRSW